MSYLVYFRGKWDNFVIKDHESLDDAISFARALGRNPEANGAAMEHVFFIRNIQTNEFWLNAGEQAGDDGWVPTGVDDIRAYYQKTFGDSDPFGLMLFDFHQ